MDEAAAEEKSEGEARQLVENFMSQLDVDEEVAIILVQEGLTTIDEVAYIPEAELIEISEFDEEIVQELRGRARDALLTMAIAREETAEAGEPQDDLLNMEFMTNELAIKLSLRGICTMEDLAEQSTDELVEIEGIDTEFAGKLIMKAREPWFAEAEAEQSSVVSPSN
jgi:N utilization substance protein A